jgi:hypothetical protein
MQGTPSLDRGGSTHSHALGDRKHYNRCFSIGPAARRRKGHDVYGLQVSRKRRRSLALRPCDQHGKKDRCKGQVSDSPALKRIWSIGVLIKFGYTPIERIPPSSL